MFGVSAWNVHSKYHNTEADSCLVYQPALLSRDDTKWLQHLTDKSLCAVSSRGLERHSVQPQLLAF